MNASIVLLNNMKPKNLSQTPIFGDAPGNHLRGRGYPRFFKLLILIFFNLFTYLLKKIPLQNRQQNEFFLTCKWV